MAAMHRSKPLANFPLIRSRNFDQVREAVARIYANATLVSARGVAEVDATINRCRLSHTALIYSSYGVAVRLDYPATDSFSLLVPIHGKGQISCGRMAAALPIGTSAVASASVSHKVTYDAEYEHLILQIDARALSGRLAAMTGATIGKPLQMAPPTNSDHPAARMLRHYLPLLVDTVGAAAPPFPAWWVEQTEQLLMMLFLFGHRHNYYELLERPVPDAAPLHVRRAEEYIEANADRAVSLEELAELTGVSIFSLFSSFRKYRGYSPTAFHSQVRSRRGGACL